MQLLMFSQYSALTPVSEVIVDSPTMAMDSPDYQDVESISSTSTTSGHGSMDFTSPSKPQQSIYVDIKNSSNFIVGNVNIFLRIFQWISPSVDSGLDLEDVSSRTREAALEALNIANMPFPDFKDVPPDKTSYKKKRYWIYGVLITSIICITCIVFSFSSDGENLNPDIIGVNTSKNEDLMFFDMNLWINDMKNDIMGIMVLICFIHTALSVLNPLYQWVKGYRIRTAAEDEYLLHSDLLPFAPRIMKRLIWLAQPPTHPLDDNSLPVERVIIIHTASADYKTSPDNCLLTRNIQMVHIESRKWSDISYNFLIGGDGCVYEGRGWEKVGEHTKGYNRGSLGIAFIGTYISKLPRENQLEALSKLINLGVKLKKISENYKINVHCQLQSTLSPGAALARHMSTWDHFDSSLPVPF